MILLQKSIENLVTLHWILWRPSQWRNYKSASKSAGSNSSRVITFTIRLITLQKGLNTLIPLAFG